MNAASRLSGQVVYINQHPFRFAIVDLRRARGARRLYRQGHSLASCYNSLNHALQYFGLRYGSPYPCFCDEIGDGTRV